MSRFYIDGIEIDVQEPLFYQDIDEVDQLITQLSEYKNDNQPQQMA